MTELKRWIVRHDRTGQQIIVKGKRLASVERRYPTNEYTVLGAMPPKKDKSKGGHD